MTYDEIQKRTSDQITKEEGLIHNRITWMLTFQGFLFAAVVLSANTNVDEHLSSLLRRTIPWLALASAGLALIGVRAAYISINSIKDTLADFLIKNPQQHHVPAHGNPLASTLGRMTSHGLPMLVILAWSYLIWQGISGSSSCCHH